MQNTAEKAVQKCKIKKDELVSLVVNFATYSVLVLNG